jgi:hypothetical protein
MNIKRITKIFNIHPKYLILKDERERWINVLRELEKYEEGELRDELSRIINLVGDEKPRYYYLESVRRNLMISSNSKMKREDMPKAIKDLF